MSPRDSMYAFLHTLIVDLQAGGLLEGLEGNLPNMLQIGGAADARLFLPLALPAKIADFDRKWSVSEVRALSSFLVLLCTHLLVRFY